ncbi:MULTISPECIES: hypothetical protein [Pedobacter]|uniref:YobI-like P-loop NTPase domain-containing protein n=1 Tax=Pedobacter suwonensis TaxID=332999 RepID=A0A1I0TW45_9SPHI|nr:MULTISPECIES: hypothetical protein [Pedobacter]SFA55146.1 hypothetical protein SAMN04488511_11496 [Pedobacter suwonensis]
MIIRDYAKSEMDNAQQTTSHSSTQVQPSSNTETPQNVISLAPKVLTDPKDLERVKPYLDLLKLTIDEPKITNIALTGSYGSGKSTIINTFESQHKEYEYLRISLASFGDVAKEVADLEETLDEEIVEIPTANGSVLSPVKGKKQRTKKKSLNKGHIKDKKEELERLLEISILQQIFYHVKPSDIPDSRFKRITNITDRHIYSIAGALILWITSALLLFKFDYINRINPASWHWKLPLDYSAFPIFMVFFVGIGLTAKSIIRLLGNSKINKVTIKGELELGDKLDKSVFNEHLEEILYFFERTPFNLVIIEDLDRFESTDIFSKLRELNTLLNNSLSIKSRKNHKEIVFLYAIRDEIFEDKNERVKFFEYIIPVIPFINPSNAGEQLAKLISGAGLENVLSKEFTEDVVTFIDDIDMRLLINIFHEYQLYRTSLSQVLLQDKLFAMIAYKNICPEDFGKLHSRKGKLYKFIANKAGYIEELIKNLDEQIVAKVGEVKVLEELKFKDLNELIGVYVNALQVKFPDAASVKAGGKKTFAQLVAPAAFEELSKLNSFTYYYFNHYSGSTYHEHTKDERFSFAELERLVDKNKSFKQRKQLIDQKNGGAIEQLKKEIDELRSEKNTIANWSISEIFERIEIDPYLKPFGENQLIRNLLINGYIDEHYDDYISLFHEVNMTAEDSVFERKIKSGSALPVEHQLTHADYVVKKLDVKYFKREVILNLDLVVYLLNAGDQVLAKCQAILQLLSEGRTQTNSFIDEFVQKRPEHAGLFIKQLAKAWLGFWIFLETKSNYPAGKMDKYLKFLTIDAGLDIVAALKGDMAKYIAKRSNFLSLFIGDAEVNPAKGLLEKLNVKFIAIDPPNQNSQTLFDFVYEHDLYELNEVNIVQMLKEKGHSEIGLESNANYTSIMVSMAENLHDYITANVNEYVQNVLLKLSQNKEEEEQMVALLNDENLIFDLKSEVIQRGFVEISDLAAIDELEIRKEVMDYSEVFPSWENVFTYYDQLPDAEEGQMKELDETLLMFLDAEENYQELSKTKMLDAPSRSQEFVKTFIETLLAINELDIEAYKALFKAQRLAITKLVTTGMTRDKIEWLVKSGAVLMTQINYDRLKKDFPDLHITLLEVRQVSYKTFGTSYDVDEQDIVKLLKSTTFTVENKLVLYNLLDEDTIVSNREISNLSCNLICDMGNVPVTFAVMESMFKSSSSAENRIKLLNERSDTLSNDQVVALITELKGDYPELFHKRHKPKFQRTPYHDWLFRVLERRKLIHRFEVDKKDECLFRVFANHN